MSNAGDARLPRSNAVWLPSSAAGRQRAQRADPSLVIGVLGEGFAQDDTHGRYLAQGHGGPDGENGEADPVRNAGETSGITGHGR
jgi:hypothetical protein